MGKFYKEDESFRAAQYDPIDEVVFGGETLFIVKFFSLLALYKGTKSLINRINYMSKKNSTNTASSGPSEPGSPTSAAYPERQPKLLQTISSNVPSTSKKSKSKGKRISAKKLFQKAHETEEGETYLKGMKGPKSLGLNSNGRTCIQAKLPKANTLMVSK